MRHYDEAAEIGQTSVMVVVGDVLTVKRQSAFETEASFQSQRSHSRSGFSSCIGGLGSIA